MKRHINDSSVYRPTSGAWRDISQIMPTVAQAHDRAIKTRGEPVPTLADEHSQ
jgi:hypothetical protein